MMRRTNLRSASCGEPRRALTVPPPLPRPLKVRARGRGSATTAMPCHKHKLIATAWLMGTSCSQLGSMSDHAFATLDLAVSQMRTRALPAASCRATAGAAAPQAPWSCWPQTRSESCAVGVRGSRSVEGLARALLACRPLFWITSMRLGVPAGCLPTSCGWPPCSWALACLDPKC